MNTVIKYTGIAVLSLSLLACGSEEAKEESAETTKKVNATMIRTATVELAPIRYWVETVGVLESINSPRIAAEVSGKIIKILVESGEVVAAGEVLLVVDSSNLKLQEKAARAELKQLSVLKHLLI
jgi:multidrug efflux pump subunit AcrA (membrane-fusion protein)